MKISSRTPVKVKRRSFIVWMMDHRASHGPGDRGKDVARIHGKQVASSGAKRSFSKETVVRPEKDAASTQPVKKVKVAPEDRRTNDGSSWRPHSSQSDARSNSAALQENDDFVNRSFSQKICTSFGCGGTGDHSQEDPSASSLSSFCDTVALDSSNSSSGASSSEGMMTPKVHYYSRHTTWRLRNSSPNRHSPLIARQLRF
jgi:hypothetical protein